MCAPSILGLLNKCIKLPNVMDGFIAVVCLDAVCREMAISMDFDYLFINVCIGELHLNFCCQIKVPNVMCWSLYI